MRFVEEKAFPRRTEVIPGTSVRSSWGRRQRSTSLFTVRLFGARPLRPRKDALQAIADPPGTCAHGLFRDPPDASSHALRRIFPSTSERERVSSHAFPGILQHAPQAQSLVGGRPIYGARQSLDADAAVLPRPDHEQRLDRTRAEVEGRAHEVGAGGRLHRRRASTAQALNAGLLREHRLAWPFRKRPTHGASSIRRTGQERKRICLSSTRRTGKVADEGEGAEIPELDISVAIANAQHRCAGATSADLHHACTVHSACQKAANSRRMKCAWQTASQSSYPASSREPPTDPSWPMTSHLAW
eukprot:scaffold69_cov248-Pinguiococcus_pyrenoidosus.AAC.48